MDEPTPQSLSVSPVPQRCTTLWAPPTSSPDDTSVGVTRARLAVLRASWDVARGVGQPRRIEVAEVVLAYMAARHFLRSLRMLNRARVRPKRPTTPTPPIPVVSRPPLPPPPREAHVESGRPSPRPVALKRTVVVPLPHIVASPPPPLEVVVAAVEPAVVPSKDHADTIVVAAEVGVDDDVGVTRAHLEETLRNAQYAVRCLAELHGIVTTTTTSPPEEEEEEEEEQHPLRQRWTTWRMRYLRHRDAVPLAVRGQALALLLASRRMSALYFHWRRRWRARSMFRAVGRQGTLAALRSCLHQWMGALVRRRIVDRSCQRTAWRTWALRVRGRAVAARRGDALLATCVRRWRWAYTRKMVRDRVVLLGYFGKWRSRWRRCQVLSVVCAAHRTRCLARAWRGWRGVVRARVQRHRDTEAADLFRQMICVRRRRRARALVMRVLRLWRAHTFLRMANR